MANICRNKIAVVGLKEPPEEFVKKLSKAMFGIDLDNIDVSKWDNYQYRDGELYLSGSKYPLGDKNVDTSMCEEGKFYDVDLRSYSVDFESGSSGSHKVIREVAPTTWYDLVAQGGKPPLHVLVPRPAFVKYGVSVPRFYVEKKWDAVDEELIKASKEFPDLLFHVDYFLEDDGPSGEFVVRNGKIIHQVQSPTAWYLFDELTYPRDLSLLPQHMGLTLAQRGMCRVEDAIKMIEGLKEILNDPRLFAANSDQHRDRLEATKKTIDDLLDKMRQAARELTFDGVFLGTNPFPTLSGSSLEAELGLEPRKAAEFGPISPVVTKLEPEHVPGEVIF
jgi:hypothetical protein